MFALVHGSYVDHDGNVWVTDANEEETVTGMNTKGRGGQVFKFNSAGKLMTILGKAGVLGSGPDTFVAPTDVVVASNGDIFVTDGHFANSSNNRVVKLSADGKFIKSWGKTGSAPGQFDSPHTIAIDRKGRIFVGDRGNNRIQIFDQDGKFLDQWAQFGRPSGIAIGPDDTIAVTDSSTTSSNNPGRNRGIYIGNARTGEVTDFIPDPDVAEQDRNIVSGATGIAVGADGTIYAGDIGPARVRKYEKVKH